MSSLFFEKDADSIYEEYLVKSESASDQQQEEEEEYREDRMEQMISRHSY